MSEPLIDKFGRSYEQLIALGRKILPRLSKHGHFIPKSPGRPPGVKTKPKMETTPAPAETVHAPTSTTPAETAPAAAPLPAPEFADVKKALASIPGESSGGSTSAPTPEGLAEELKHLGDNPTAETIIGLIQTALILVGQEEGQLSALEKDLIRRPLVRVLAKYDVGKDVLPPEVDLVLAVLGVVAVRLQKPKTAAFASKVRHWITEKFFGMKGRKLANHLQSEVGPSVDRTHEAA